MKIQHQDKPQHPVNVIELLENANFPMTKLEIIGHLESQNPDGRIMNLAQAIPEGQYETIEELNEALGKIDTENAGHAPDQNINES